MPPNVVWALAIFAAVNVLAFLVVVHAFARGTAGWIVTGSLSLIFLLAVWVWLGISVYREVNGMNRKRRMTGDTHSFEVTSARQINGTKLPYKIVLPAGWRLFWGNVHLDIGMQDEAGLFGGVVADESVGTSIEAANQARERVKARGVNARFGEIVPVQIDGRTWLSFTAQWQHQKPAAEMHEKFYVYSGQEGLFEVLVWRSEAFHPRDDSIINEIATSFRFPVPTRTSPTPLHFEALQSKSPNKDPKTVP